MGANRLDTCNSTQMMYSHAVTRTSAHRTNTMMIAATHGVPLAVAMRSTVALVDADTGRIDTTPQMTRGIPAPVGWDRDTRSHPRCPTHGGLSPTDVPASDMDVRTMLGVGEERQGGKTRRSGDACDSLVL